MIKPKRHHPDHNITQAVGTDDLHLLWLWLREHCDDSVCQLVDVYKIHGNGIARNEVVTQDLAYNINRLISITQGTNSVTFAYDAANRRTRTTYSNGIVATYGYDNASRLTSISYTKGAAPLGDLTYTHDPDGRITTKGGSLATTVLANSQPTTAYNTNHQLTTWGATTLSYDANGNLLSDGVNSYSWNARNQLTAISGAVTASFQYDALGRRNQKTINGQTTRYLYDGLNPVQELNASNTPTANLLTGGLDEYLMRTDSAGLRTFLTDHLGSTI
ncbi:MAG: RHS repeat-associated core domain protein, partial [Halothiobacillaceae bacterium]